MSKSQKIWATKHSLFWLLLIMLTIAGCKGKPNEASEIVNSWMGKKITFPPGISCTKLGEEVPCISVKSAYKVLVYTDSAGCVSCNLRIDEWKKIITASKSRQPDLFSFHFYFNPRTGDNLTDLFKKENFKETVFIDRNDLLNKANNFSNQMLYQCFLLNERDEVVLIGNPTLNSNIHDIYMRIIDRKFIPGNKEEVTMH